MIKMDAEDTIKSLTEPFGGSVWCEQRDDEYADMWKWQANRIADIWTILIAARPYLRHKASEADEVLEHIRENQAAYIAEIDT